MVVMREIRTRLAAGEDLSGQGVPDGAVARRAGDGRVRDGLWQEVDLDQCHQGVGVGGSAYSDESRGMSDLLRGYAYGETAYPFVIVLRDMVGVPQP
jgi:hypothetical protein